MSLRRCLHALAEWERLSEACRYEWRRLEPHVHPQMAHLGANAAWHMGHWDEMATYVSAIESEEGPELSTGSFLSAVLNVRHGNYAAAKGEWCLCWALPQALLLPYSSLSCCNVEVALQTGLLANAVMCLMQCA